MEREPVTSSVIRSVGYDKQVRTLEVELVEGAVYQYFLVPERAYRQLLAAPSVGRHYNSDIKPRYPYRKIR